VGRVERLRRRSVKMAGLNRNNSMEISSNSHRMMSNILLETLNVEIKKRSKRHTDEIKGLECNAMYQEVNRQRRLMGKNEPVSISTVSSIYNNTNDSYSLAARLAELVLFDFVEISNLNLSLGNR
jgi:hypothetical protein